MRLRPLAAILVVLLLGCGDDDLPEPPAAAQESGRADSFALKRIAAGFVRPTWAGAAPGTQGLYVLEQTGRLMRLAPDGRRSVVLDMTGRVALGTEQGMLGVAFAPDFSRSRRFYVHWSAKGTGDTRVAEFVVGADGRADVGRRRVLLRVGQPEENHNGGQLAFGPDGRLYLGLGDGGGAFDPEDNAQDPGTLLGKLISTDVDVRPESGTSRAGWRVELTGLRNPWRFSFDPALGEVWIADVGQDAREEVTRVALEPDEPPKNLGWPVFEGTREVGKGKEPEGDGELVFPAVEYDHDAGCSVTGGLVYRGSALPALSGRYVYGDFCTGALWSLEPRPGRGARDVRRERVVLPQLTHVGTDAAGELVFASATGELKRAVRRKR